MEPGKENSMNSTDKYQANYGNWLPRKFIYLSGFPVLVWLGLSSLSPLFLIGAAVSLIPFVYCIYAYRQFSPRGGNLQVKIRNLVLDKLVWKGEGRALDIGCGNGALTIALAQQYPHAQVAGIDYWGGKWDYSRQACVRNSEAAGVGAGPFFRKPAPPSCLLRMSLSRRPSATWYSMRLTTRQIKRKLSGKP